MLATRMNIPAGMTINDIRISPSQAVVHAHSFDLQVRAYKMSHVLKRLPHENPQLQSGRRWHGLW
jgi:hypothetical protein